MKLFNIEQSEIDKLEESARLHIELGELYKREAALRSRLFDLYSRQRYPKKKYNRFIKSQKHILIARSEMEEVMFEFGSINDLPSQLKNHLTHVYYGDSIKK